jgi:hypothetical protein
MKKVIGGIMGNPVQEVGNGGQGCRFACFIRSENKMKVMSPSRKINDSIRKSSIPFDIQPAEPHDF